MPREFICLWIFTQGRLFNSNELLSIRFLPSVRNIYKGAYLIINFHHLTRDLLLNSLTIRSWIPYDQISELSKCTSKRDFVASYLKSPKVGHFSMARSKERITFTICGFVCFLSCLQIKTIFNCHMSCQISKKLTKTYTILLDESPTELVFESLYWYDDKSLLRHKIIKNLQNCPCKNW